MIGLIDVRCSVTNISSPIAISASLRISIGERVQVARWGDPHRSCSRVDDDVAEVVDAQPSGRAKTRVVVAGSSIDGRPVELRAGAEQRAVEHLRLAPAERVEVDVARALRRGRGVAAAGELAQLAASAPCRTPVRRKVTNSIGRRRAGSVEPLVQRRRSGARPPRARRRRAARPGRDVTVCS